MKRLSLISLALLFATALLAVTPFRFAQLTDIHLTPGSNSPLEDLRRSIDEINSQPDIAFVIISGDVTESGDSATMEVAKAEFKRLKMKYYVTSGNHETTWSESGCTAFSKVFGSDRFSFEYNDIFFLGMNSGPVLKMADGHIAPQDITWATKLLAARPAGQPVICITHYPLQNGDVDNWYDLTDLLRQYNTQCVIGGHYHRNLLFNADGIPDILGRSNLRGKAAVNGYTIISVDNDSIRFAEKVIGEEPRQWVAVPFEKKEYGPSDESIRPDYTVNATSPVEEMWRCSLGVGVYNAAATDLKNAYVGDDEGMMYAINLQDGSIRWKYRTGSRIAGAAWAGKGRVIFGSTDGKIYSLSNIDGEKQWTFQTGKAVQGCPIVTKVNGEDAVLVGGNGAFYALSLNKGTLLWKFTLPGYVVTRPCVYNGMVYFGAWDCNLYAVRISDGTLVWKWNNGTTADKMSPAAVWPVAANGRLYIVAPDRVFTCFDAATGEVIYRTKEFKVRENLGISLDGKTLYAHCMWDTIVAFDATTNQPTTRWVVSGEYGYEHDPSMPIFFPNTSDADGLVVFGIKNGLMFGVDAQTGKIAWRYKVGNCVVNTICPTAGLRDSETLIKSFSLNKLSDFFKKGKSAPKTDFIVTSSDGNVIRLRAPFN